MPFFEKSSIDISNSFPLDHTIILNHNDYSGIYVNGGSEDIIHDGFTIPSYTIIEPDGMQNNISVIAEEGSRVVIFPSPLSDAQFMLTQTKLIERTFIGHLVTISYLHILLLLDPLFLEKNIMTGLMKNGPMETNTMDLLLILIVVF